MASGPTARACKRAMSAITEADYRRDPEAAFLAMMEIARSVVRARQNIKGDDQGGETGQ